MATLCVYLWVSSFSAIGSNGAEAVQVTDGNWRLPISSLCMAAVDLNASWSIATIPDSAWQPCNETPLARGYTDSRLWLTWTLTNPSAREVDLFLHFPIPWLSRVELFREQNLVETIDQSDPFFDRPIALPGFTFPLTIPMQTETKFTVSIDAVDSFIAEGYLVTFKSLLKLESETQFFAGILFGSILFLALYNLILFLLVRDTSYLFYVAYTLSIALLAGTIYGFTFQFLWPEAPDFNYRMTAATSGLCYCALIVFIQRFLVTHKNLPKTHRVLTLLAIIGGIQAVLSFTAIPRNWAIESAALFGLLGTTGVLITLIYAWWNRIPSAGYALAAYSFLLVATPLFSALIYGFVEFSWVSYRAFGVGALFEVLIFSSALANRIKRLRLKTSQAREAALQAQIELTEGLTQAKETLEQQVAERTEELEKAKLSAEQLAMTDELTQLNNRRAFFHLGNTFFADAQRRHSALTVLMMDIDHFKKINDTHGHATGDKAIQSAARGILTCSRASDLCGRIGGEEFALLLPNTDANQALELAERIRQHIQTLSVPSGSETVSFTCSIGISQIVEKDDHLEEVMVRADEGLYAAKEAGRNRVRVYEPKISP